MDAAKVVVHEIQCDVVGQILNLLAEGVRQPRKSTHRHSHGEVLALDVQSRDVIRIRIACDYALCASDANRRAVFLFGIRRRPIELVKRCIVDVVSKCSIDCHKIGSQAVSCKLEHARLGERLDRP